MAAKSKLPKRKKSAEKEQYQRFLATAREAGASKDPKDLDKAVRTLTRRPLKP
jgi:hypothetical protein